MFLGVVILLITDLCLGFVLGVYVTQAWSKYVRRAPDEPTVPLAAGPAPTEPRLQEVLALLRRLLELAGDVDQNLTKHTAQVSQVNEALEVVADDQSAALAMLLAELVQANTSLHAKLIAAGTEFEQGTQLIQAQVEVDEVGATPQPLHQQWTQQELPRLLDESQRAGRPLCLAGLKIDRFSQFAEIDRERATSDTAEILLSHKRGKDILHRGDAGDFQLLLPDTPPAEAMSVAEGFREALAARKLRIDEAATPITASLGLTEALATDDASSFVHRCEAALHAAQEAGGNCGFYVDSAGCKPIRHSPRIAFEGIEYIARYDGGPVPAPDQFQAVKCHDISAGGFSFVAIEPPKFSRLVLRLGIHPHETLMDAQVARITDRGASVEPRYQVGCRFIGRLGTPVLSKDSAPALLRC